MVASRISVLILSTSNRFPNRSVVGKFIKVNFDNWGSNLFRLLIGVHLSLRQ